MRRTSQRTERATSAASQVNPSASPLTRRCVLSAVPRTQCVCSTCTALIGAGAVDVM